MKIRWFFPLIGLLLPACALHRYQAQFVESEPRADTRIHAIYYQDKDNYYFNNRQIRFDNRFDAGRMNRCEQINDSLFAIRIEPENYPINESPWYAFRVISASKNPIWVRIDYEKSKHRYPPRTSTDRIHWALVDSAQLTLTRGDSSLIFPLSLKSDTTWVAAQEIHSSADVKSWLDTLAGHKSVQLSEYGQSMLGQKLFFLELGTGKKRKKPILVLTSRHHPPEITGYLALKAFVATLLEDTPASKAFLKKYRVLVYPLVNPDGVDLGHWRHNAGGVDLNRDWGNYHQPEIRQLCDHLVTQEKRFKGTIQLGIDFHSTWKDIYYTNTVDPASLEIGDFTSNWIQSVASQLDSYVPVVEPSGVRPVATSKNWFYAELGAEGITYEVGDQSPRDFIRLKAKISAKELMQLLLQ